MMNIKYIYIIIHFLLIFISITAYCNENDIIVRNAKWKMSHDEIKINEYPKIPKVDTEKYLWYDDIINDEECLIIYEFENKKLVEITINFLKIPSKIQRDKLYKYIETILDNKYSIEYIANTNKEYKLNDKDDTTEISLVKSDSDEKPNWSLMVMYRTKEFAKKKLQEFNKSKYNESKKDISKF